MHMMPEWPRWLLRWWSIGKARQHCIVMGNDGKLTNGRIDASSVREGLRKTVEDLLSHYQGHDFMIFAHGGLNTKEDVFRRAQVLGHGLKTIKFCRSLWSGAPAFGVHLPILAQILCTVFSQTMSGCAREYRNLYGGCSIR